MKVGIVILNYKAYRETIRCVYSIRTRIETCYPIVIVENGSANGSYECLKDYYADWDLVDVIRNDRNVGFAKGNNTGIAYIRGIYKVDFVLLLNSDTQIKDRLYIDKLLAKYQKGVGAVEANVLNDKGNFVQPALWEASVEASFDMLLRTVCRYYDIYWPFRRKGKGKSYLCQIGCAILLTPDYFAVYQGLYSYTFLYGEEHILLLLLNRAGLALEFADNTYICHSEGGSTGFSFLEGSRKKERKVIRAYWNVLLASLLPYKRLIEAARTPPLKEVLMGGESDKADGTLHEI